PARSFRACTTCWAGATRWASSSRSDGEGGGRSGPPPDLRVIRFGLRRRFLHLDQRPAPAAVPRPGLTVPAPSPKLPRLFRGPQGLRTNRRPCIKHRTTDHPPAAKRWRSEEHRSELQSRENLGCRLLLENKKTT